MTVDDSRRSARGPHPVDAADRRTHTVSVRVNAGELAALDSARAVVGMQRGEYLRAAALHRLPAAPPVIPELNREAWMSLARAAGNLNQIARHMNDAGVAANAGLRETLAECIELMTLLRGELLGARGGGDGPES